MHGAAQRDLQAAITYRSKWVHEAVPDLGGVGPDGSVTMVDVAGLPWGTFVEALAKISLLDERDQWPRWSGTTWPAIKNKSGMSRMLQIVGFEPSVRANLDQWVGAVRHAADHVLTYCEQQESEQMRYGLYDPSQTFRTVLQRWQPPALKLEDSLFVVREAALLSLQLEKLIFFLKKGDFLDRPFRSRMAEIVRLVSLLKQRFATDRYYTQSKELVKDVRFEVRRREVPVRDQPLDALIDEIKNATAGDYDSVLLQRAVGIFEQVCRAMNRARFSRFQRESLRHLLERGSTSEDTADEALVVCAGTGAGKTLSFFLPALFRIIIERCLLERPGVKLLAIYPRQKLAENQVEEFIEYGWHVNRTLAELNVPHKMRVGIEYGGTPYDQAKLSKWKHESGVYVCPYSRCPACPSDSKRKLILRPGEQMLRCEDPSCPGHAGLPYVLITKEQFAADPPDVMVALTESLNDRLMGPKYQKLFGSGDCPGPKLIVLDEIHLQNSVKGMSIGYLMRRILQRIKYHQRQQGSVSRLQVVGLSATIKDPEAFMEDLTGIPQGRTTLLTPRPEDMTAIGAQYFLFCQAEDRDEVAVMSALIQTAMVIVHNMAQPRPYRLARIFNKGQGVQRFRVFGFVNARDLAYRWKDNQADAEQKPIPGLAKRGLHILRSPEQIETSTALKRYFGRQQPGDCSNCKENPDQECIAYRQGECWWLMRMAGGLEEGMTVAAKTGFDGELSDEDLVVATSALEVGYDDEAVMAVIQYMAPTDLAAATQRQGRAGRLVGTRPLMVYLLSPHRPSDTFYFRNHRLLTDPEYSRVPLNPENLLVRRIHGFYALCDFWAYWEAQNGRTFLGFPSVEAAQLQPLRASLKMATHNRNFMFRAVQYMGRVLGLQRGRVLRELIGDRNNGIIPAGLKRLVQTLEGMSPASMPAFMKLEDILDAFLPGALFQDLNLPDAVVNLPAKPEREPVETVLRELAPGRVSQRWRVPVWVPPTGLQPLSMSGTSTVAALMPIAGAFTLQPNHEERLNLTGIPLHVRNLLFGSVAQQQLTVYRPKQVLAQPLKNDQNRVQWWHDSVTDRVYNSTERRPANPERLITAKSNSYPINLTVVDHTPNGGELPLMAKNGPLQNLLTHVEAADGTTGYARITEVVLGFDATLKMRGGDEWTKVIGLVQPHDRELIAVGYQMQTEAVRISLHPEFHRSWDPPGRLVERVRRNLLTYRFVRLAREKGWGNLFWAELWVDAYMTYEVRREEAGLNRGEVLAEVESGAWLPYMEEVLQEVYGDRPGKTRQAVLIALTDGQKVKGFIDLARPTLLTESDATVCRDTLQHTLKHALKKAAQSAAGVAANAELGATTRLREDHPGAGADIWLYEYGMYGIGVIQRVLDELRHSPAQFWSVVDSEISHCPVGDEEDFLHQILALGEAHLETLAALVLPLQAATDISQREDAMRGLKDYFRDNFGLTLEAGQIKALRRVFIRPLDLLEERASMIRNWALYQYLDLYQTKLEGEWGRRPTDTELVHCFAAAILAGSLSAVGQDWLDLFHWLSQDTRRVVEALLQDVEENCKKQLYQELFCNKIVNIAELEHLIGLTEDERTEALQESYGVPASLARDFQANAFAEQYGISLARLYFERLNGNPTGTDYGAQLLKAGPDSALKRALRQRVIGTCVDGCPHCLHDACHLESGTLGRLTLNRRLLADFVEQQKNRTALEVEPGMRPETLVRQIRKRLKNGEVRVRFGNSEYDLALQTVTTLTDEGLPVEGAPTFDVIISGSDLLRVDLAERRSTFEIVITLGGGRNA